MAEIIQGVAALLWPIIVIILIVVIISLFKPAIAAIMESAKSRKLIIEIGGYKLTLDEASEQQRKIITDIQTRLLEIEKKVKGETISPISLEMYPLKTPEQEMALLWVDDNPKNNSYYLQQLSEMGLTIDLAMSTSDGLKKFSPSKHALVISDMGREENRSTKDTAGLELLKNIRSIDPNIPFVIFTTYQTARIYAISAKAQGATLITSSWLEVFGILVNIFEKRLVGS